MGRLSDVILGWPSEHPLDARKILDQHPDLRNDSIAVITLAMEEYIDRWERDAKVDAGKFVTHFPSVASVLLRRLNQIDLLGEDAPVTPWPKTGDIFQGFSIDELLGVGSFSRVYLCRQQELNDRSVVLKITTDTVLEFEMLARLSHPGITTLHSSHFDQATGFNACCQKFFSRWTAADLLSQYHSSIPNEITDPWQLDKINFHDTVISLIIEVASALSYAHENGVLHNDIKPSNILVSEKFHSQLIDFNAASRLGDVLADRFIGTLPYLPPEILKAIATSKTTTLKPTQQTDIYALAVCCYEMLTGKLPFEPPSQKTPFVESCKHLVHQHDNAIKPIYSTRILKVIQRALSYDSNDRYASAEEFAQELRRAAQPVIHQKLLRVINRKNIWTISKYSAALIVIAFLLFNLRWRIVSPSVSANSNNSTQEVPVRHPQLPEQDLFKESLKFISNDDFIKAERALIAECIKTNSPRSYALLAFVQYKLKRPYSDVLASNKSAVEGGLNNPRVLSNLGYSLIRQRRPEEAAVILNQAIESETTLFQPYYHRAVVELFVNKTSKKLPDPKYIAKALESAPSMKIVISTAKTTCLIWKQSGKSDMTNSFSRSEQKRVQSELELLRGRIHDSDSSTSEMISDFEPFVFPFEDEF